MTRQKTTEKNTLELGTYCFSLAAKEIEVSRLFYEKLGVTIFGGDQSLYGLIMKNGDSVIGLFQGMCERNLLTFNPGGNQNAEPLAAFTDVRELHDRLNV